MRQLSKRLKHVHRDFDVFYPGNFNRYQSSRLVKLPIVCAGYCQTEGEVVSQTICIVVIRCGLWIENNSNFSTRDTNTTRHFQEMRYVHRVQHSLQLFSSHPSMYGRFCGLDKNVSRVVFGTLFLTQVEDPDSLLDDVWATGRGCGFGSVSLQVSYVSRR